MNPEVPKNSKLAAVAVLPMVGITLYWTFTYSGPYRYLAELQVKWFGYYVPKLTAMVIILGFLAIAGVIKVVLRGAERPVPGPANAPVAAVPINKVAVPQTWLQDVRYASFDCRGNRRMDVFQWYASRQLAATGGLGFCVRKTAIPYCLCRRTGASKQDVSEQGKPSVYSYVYGSKRKIPGAVGGWRG